MARRDVLQIMKQHLGAMTPILVDLTRIFQLTRLVKIMTCLRDLSARDFFLQV